MNKEEIINKFINNKKKSYEELEFIFLGYLNDKVSDEEMVKVLRSICKYEMRKDEIFALVDIFINSGDTISLDEIDSCVDKHSTGGVGDKVTLIVAPLVASVGVKIAKLSGRALGHTGGTIDKLESIGVKTDISVEDFIKQVNDINVAIASQTKNLCPLDKKVYALRDVSNTTKSISLIASSIMSKKIASGSKKIVIDVKVGKGALINNKRYAIKLSKLMIEIGKKYNREVICILTRMDNPLGTNIGNKIEIMEAIDILSNKKENELSYLCLKIASLLVSMDKNISYDEAYSLVYSSLKEGKAYDKFKELVIAQDGSLSIDIGSGKKIYSKDSGYIKSINSLTLGKFSMKLGAGRVNKEDSIDYNAGIILNKEVGSYVKEGDLLCTIYGNTNIDIEDLYKAYTFSKKKVKIKDVVIGIIK